MSNRTAQTGLPVLFPAWSLTTKETPQDHIIKKHGEAAVVCWQFSSIDLHQLISAKFKIFPELSNNEEISTYLECDSHMVMILL